METIGKYEIVRRMGTGALGEVYEVRAPNRPRGVLRTCAIEDPIVRQQFLSAGELLRNLVHPAVAAILDAGVASGTPYVVEEFLSGEALDRRLERGAPFALPESMAILFQIAQALRAGGTLEMAHRDLRPAHVRLVGESRIKLQGFGIAHLAKGGAGHTPRSGDAPAEIAYVAPEQIRGEAADERSDQFAFGVIAYELLSGRRPFGGEHAADLMVQILSAEPIALGERSPDCPQAMARVVARCLEKDPARRFQDPAELVAAIAPLVDVVTEGPRQVTRVMDPAELQPEAPSPVARRAEARARIAQHLLRGELAQAEAALREAERAPGSAGTFADLRTRLAELRDVDRHNQVKSLLDSARRFLAAGDLDLAQRACVEALTLEPAESEAHRLLADAQQELERRRHEDELEASRTIARFAVAELLASPEPPPRELPRAAAAQASSAPPPARRPRGEDDTENALEATVAGNFASPIAAPAVEAEWPSLPPSQQLPALPPDLPIPPLPTEALPTSPPPEPVAPPPAPVVAPAAAAAPAIPPAAQRLADRVERLLASGALPEARVAIEELKAEIHGNEAVRALHARWSAALLDAFQAQRRGRISGAQPLVDAPGSRAFVTGAPPARGAAPSPPPRPAPVEEVAPEPVVAAPVAAAAPAKPPKTGGGRGALIGGLVALGLVVAGGAGWFLLRGGTPPPPPPAAPAPPKPARLAIPANALAGLTVRVDGGAPEPLSGGLAREMPAGEHVLLFESPGNTPQELRVTLAAGEARSQSTPIFTPLPPPEPEPEATVAAPAAAKTRRKKAVVEPVVAPAPVEAPAPAPAPAAPPPTRRGDLVEAGPGVVAPRTLSIPGAKYPDRARREKREATIGILVLVDENGAPVATKVQEGDPFGVGFDEAALTAVRAARFEPATKDGVAVKMWKLVRVGFRLK